MKIITGRTLCRLAFPLTLAVAQASPTFTNGVSQGNISIPFLTEASGIVASRNNAGVLWTHNDSGDSPRIFAIDTQGRLLGTYNLTNASHTDYEDIGLGPGPVAGVGYIYVGDIGDNSESRSNIKVYQIPEPAVYARQYLNPLTANLKGSRTITLNYPDGAHNAETLFVDPWTGDLFIATKHAGTSSIYLAPKAALDLGNTLTMTWVRTINFDIASGGDISPTGLEIIIRQENFANLWSRAPGQSISNALAATPVSIPVIGTPAEPNGEAVAFDGSGSGYYTVSETAASQPLYYFRRTSADGPKAPRTLVGAGSTWRYLDNGSDQGSGWRDSGFDDSAWASGSGQFGYGNGDEQTLVTYGGNASNKYLTTYFRETFMLENAACITNLAVNLLFDDGAAVYLNGTLIIATNLTIGATFNTLASATQSSLEDTWFTYGVSPSLLVDGTNTLAVEIHQASTNSNDLSFDLELVALEASTSLITSAAMQSDQQFQLRLCGPLNSSLTIESSDNLSNWTSIGGVTLTNGAGVFADPQTTNFNHRFYRSVQ